MDPIQYWDMTYQEITVSIEAYTARRKADLQLEAVLSYRQAQLIGKLVSRALGDKQKPPELQEAFPGIFPEELFDQRQDWRLMKERVAAYGARHRKRGEKKHGHDGRGTTSIDNGRDQSAPPRSGERPEAAE
ncbi:hypothetical protein [Paenibacillus illinoisensis]|uniref:hypothetical protein n=1 Tax=Paenibacillus illinoisensis TaxID=59845 RepID=UPI000FDB4F4B|nr:hypothetical protein [Paenibacillus illinoisensis]